MANKKIILSLIAALTLILAVAGVYSRSTDQGKDHSKVRPTGKARFVTYYYTYTGAQTPAARMNGANYTTPQTTSYACSGTRNECSVAVAISGTAPANLSTLDIDYNATTGFPEGGDDFVQNYLQN